MWAGENDNVDLEAAYTLGSAFVRVLFSATSCYHSLTARLVTWQSRLVAKLSHARAGHEVFSTNGLAEISSQSKLNCA